MLSDVKVPKARASRLTVILGAGASYDCADRDTASVVNDDFRPPLAKDILARRFDGILNGYPLVTARLDELRTRLSNSGDFEQIFRTLLESAANHQKFWPLLLPVYLRELFWSVSLGYIQGSSKFDTLVRRVLESDFEEVMFVNLNYDLFLEDALANYDRHQFSDIDSYMPASKKWRYVKPHGSVNWAKIMENCPSDDSGWFLPSRLQEMPVFSPDLRVAMWNRHSRDFYIPGGGPRGYLYPQVVVPTDKPKSFVCPESHEANARTFVRSCKRFLMIGFSGRDEDVVNLLCDAPAESCWTIVSGRDARATKRRVFRGLRISSSADTKWRLYDKGFARFVGDKLFDQVLQLGTNG